LKHYDMSKNLEKKMKKKIILLLSALTFLTMFLTACSGTSNQDASSTGSTDDSPGNTSLSLVNILLVGMLKLEDTKQAVTADEAEKLLPLWQAYRSLSNSQTAADVEVEALVNQIQNTMTAEQFEAIKAMNLTNTDMMDLIQSLGGGMILRGTPNPQGTPGFDFPAGGFEGDFGPSFEIQNDSGGARGGSSGGATGNFPPGGEVIIGGGPGGDAGAVIMGGGPMMQGTPDPSMQATAQARFGTMASRVNTLLLDVLISKLEAKTTNQ
jgi:hypothetical protein